MQLLRLILLPSTHPLDHDMNSPSKMLPKLAIPCMAVIALIFVAWPPWRGEHSYAENADVPRSAIVAKGRTAPQSATFKATAVGRVVAQLVGSHKMPASYDLDFECQLVAESWRSYGPGPGQPSSSGQTYWAAFCVMEALQRPRLSELTRHQVLNSYSSLLVDIEDISAREILAALPAHQVVRWRKLVEECQRRERDHIIEKLDSLVADPLFPACKRVLSTDLRGRIISSLNRRGVRPPKYREPEQLMVYRDEKFGSDIMHFCEAQSSDILFYVCAEEVYQLSEVTLYWGKSHIEIWDNDGSWPISVAMEPLALKRDSK